MNDESEAMNDESRFPSWVNWGPSQVVTGIFAGFFLGFLLAPALVLPFDSDLSSNGAILAAQGLLVLTLVIVAVSIAANFKLDPLGERLRDVFRRLGFRRFAPSAFGWMVLMFIGYLVLSAIFATLVAEPEQDDIGGKLGVGDETILIAVLAVVIIAGIQPIAEEIFFRGFIYGGLRTTMPIWAAALLSGALFGSVHIPTGAAAAVPLAILGVGFALLYEKTNSLWPCAIAHMVNNGIALAALAGS